MSRISIVDLEVFYQVGVTDEERAKSQRLLVTVEMDVDFSTASLSDRLEKTINYFDIAQELLKYGQGRNWKLLEKLVANIADFIIVKFRPETVTVEVKKFPIPQARYVSVMLTRNRS
ncbi:MAG TPA: dihydroneopterin aldolase [Verrucomicrobiae bacterium]|jgi:dihydroneopterin aldolase|nr:dihydroneopterin aldolase [Verrucomicrobiae bacterium]